MTTAFQEDAFQEITDALKAFQIDTPPQTAGALPPPWPDDWVTYGLTNHYRKPRRYPP